MPTGTYRRHGALFSANRCIELSEKRTIIESTERDALTGLYNLNYFMNYVMMYDRHYTDMPMDAIVVDVNHFHRLRQVRGGCFGVWPDRGKQPINTVQPQHVTSVFLKPRAG